MKRAHLVFLLTIALAWAAPARTEVASCEDELDGTACIDGYHCTPVGHCQSGYCAFTPLTFTQPPGSPINVLPYMVSAASGDFNRDGKPDLIVLDYTSHKFTVLLGNGAGGFTLAPGSPVTTVATFEQALTIGDFNRDGALDVAVSHASPSLISIYLGNGAGGFSPGSTVPGAGGGQLVAGDFNGDGKPDLVVVEAGHLRVLLGNGFGGFTEAPSSPVPAGQGGPIAAGDFNLDGKLDLAEGNLNPDGVLVFLGNGNGGFTQAPMVSFEAPHRLVVGDVNLDGKPDVVASSQLYVTLLSGNGQGGFSRSVLLQSPTGPGTQQRYFEGVGIGDFNGDHVPDIAVNDHTAQTFSILLNASTEYPDPSFGPVNYPTDCVVADFNLDGRADLAVVNYVVSTIGIFLSDPPVVAQDGTPCDDGNLCTRFDSCQAGACAAGAPNTCSDGNACTADSCNILSGCSHVNLANGTPCDDGDPLTEGDQCRAGSCLGSSCRTKPAPKSAGYYKMLCRDGHGQPYAGDQLTAADAACVGASTTTFAGMATVDQMCGVIGAAGDGACPPADGELMALALNVCRDRVCASQDIDSSCSSPPASTTVTASMSSADAILANSAPTDDTCAHALCLAREINEGEGLHQASLRVDKASAGNVQLSWASPVMNDGSGAASSYTIWRRALGSGDAFVQLGSTTNLSYVDGSAASGAWEYQVTFTIGP